MYLVQQLRELAASLDYYEGGKEVKLHGAGQADKKGLWTGACREEEAVVM